MLRKATAVIGKPNQRLQLALRKQIDERGLYHVAREMQIGPDTLGRYLADLPLREVTRRGIEATIAGGQSTGAGGK